MGQCQLLVESGGLKTRRHFYFSQATEQGMMIDDLAGPDGRSESVKVAFTVK